MAPEVKFDLNLCNGCKTCVDACYVDIIHWDNLKNFPVANHPEDCQICRVCEKNCPVNAITIIPNWSSKYFPRVLAESQFPMSNH
jgi:NAD-dependent dihydropyrimidine dehydrogenase PreA subunit